MQLDKRDFGILFGCCLVTISGDFRVPFVCICFFFRQMAIDGSLKQNYIHICRWSPKQMLNAWNARWMQTASFLDADATTTTKPIVRTKCIQLDKIFNGLHDLMIQYTKHQLYMKFVVIHWLKLFINHPY